MLNPSSKANKKKAFRLIPTLNIKNIFEQKKAFWAIYVFIAFFGFMRWHSGIARDFYQFWVIGQATRTMSLTNIYGDEDRTRIADQYISEAKRSFSINYLSAALLRSTIVPNGTPFLYSIFRVISTGEYDLDYSIYRIASITSFLFAVFLISRILGQPSYLIIFFALLFGEFFDPLRLDVIEGNVNGIQLGIIALILTLLSKTDSKWAYLGAGISLGLFIMFKPIYFPILFFILLDIFLTKPFKRTTLIFCGIAAGALIAFIAPFIILGRACTWFQWLGFSPGMSLVQQYMERTFLGLLFCTKTIFPHVLLSLMLVLVPIIIVLNQRLRIREAPLNIARDNFIAPLGFFPFILGVCIVLLSSPIVHPHYFTLLIPAIAYLVGASPSKRIYPRRKAICLSLLGAALFIAFNVHLTREGFGIPGINTMYYPHYYFITILIYSWAVLEWSKIAIMKQRLLS